MDKLKLWIKENNYTLEVASNKLGISRGLFRYWFNGGIVRVSLYEKIKNNMEKYNLI